MWIRRNYSYESLRFQKNVFMAQKFCHIHGLEFGMDNYIGSVFNKGTYFNSKKYASS